MRRRPTFATILLSFAVFSASACNTPARYDRYELRAHDYGIVDCYTAAETIDETLPTYRGTLAVAMVGELAALIGLMGFGLTGLVDGDSGSFGVVNSALIGGGLVVMGAGLSQAIPAEQRMMSAATVIYRDDECVEPRTRRGWTRRFGREYTQVMYGSGFW